MIPYIIKVILCSGLFLLVYKLLLEREKMHQFNRLYLLSALLLSFIIPLITFSSFSTALPDAENILPGIEMFTNHAAVQQSTPVNITSYTTLIPQAVYAVISAILFLRLLIRLKIIFDKRRKCPVIPYSNSKIVLITEDITPHSFWNCIFINKKAYQNGSIENEILVHELSHALQKHSLDILLIEILQALFWINPFLFLYKKAIQLNHEFLADEAVLKNCGDTVSYQYLLIEKASKLPGAALASQFNYSITKKRLIMMTRTKSFKKVLCRQIAIIPVLAMSILLFSTKQSLAQDTLSHVTIKKQEVPSSKEGVSQELLNEYEEIINRTKDEKGIPAYGKFSATDKKRLETIFLLMSKEQQAKQTVIFMAEPPPLPRVVPTTAQLSAWKNEKIYGLWINDKKVSNAELNKYSNTDFAQVFVSKLYGAAKKNVPYFYQVNLMTAAHYDAYYKQTTESGKKYFMGVRWGTNPILKKKA
jgi:bla regulator protein blaR1